MAISNPSTAARRPVPRGSVTTAFMAWIIRSAAAVVITVAFRCCAAIGTSSPRIERLALTSCGVVITPRLAIIEARIAT